MKLRFGFVSNSSSTSFAIYGKRFDENELKSRFKFTDDEMKDIVENGLCDYQDDNLDGLEFVELDDEGELIVWIVGGMLSGTSEDIRAELKHVDKIFGTGCKLYRGVDQDGNIYLDDE
jgi:hypothetical protein